jgi:hypothetical protein
MERLHLCSAAIAILVLFVIATLIALAHISVMSPRMIAGTRG